MRWTRIFKRPAASLAVATRLPEADFVADRTEYSFAVAAQPVSAESLAAAGNVLVRTVHGARMRTRATAFLELSRVFDFPAGSGDNADALIDLLSDLEWLGERRGYLTYIGDAAQVLADEPDQLGDWLTTIRYAQARWNDPDYTTGWSPRFRIVAVDTKPLSPAWSALGAAVALDG
ncbi:barstar family protein [Jongsikchunia kroppenstedtii]|uniref:barstar family protein n=1 Tax=Jongsikchunia kroppenstedtii TaxID=1121721 RepID=UPI00037012C3|nr:barstar family protein [Jongsikchunia kroppenstedtii]